jgi:hypothetical protein
VIVNSTNCDGHSAYVLNDSAEICVKIIAPVFRNEWKAILCAEDGVIVETTIRGGHGSLTTSPPLQGAIQFSNRPVAARYALATGYLLDAPAALNSRNLSILILACISNNNCINDTAMRYSSLPRCGRRSLIDLRPQLHHPQTRIDVVEIDQTFVGLSAPGEG